MRVSLKNIVLGLAGSLLPGCSLMPHEPPTREPSMAAAPGQVVHAAHRVVDEKLPPPDQVAAETAPREMSLPELVEMTLDRHPRLVQVGWAIETARGKAIQAGLYPNPTISVTGNELGDRTGPGGIWTAPMVSQEIVTANKLGLSFAVVAREVDQAVLTLVAERYRVLTEVRQAYFEALTLQHRHEILKALVKLAEESVENAEKLRKVKEAARLDVLQLEVDRGRFRAELEATEKSLPAAYRRLAASIGVQELTVSRLNGDLETPVPDFNLDQIRAYVLGIHPELRSAQIGVERAKLAAKRAEVAPIPNITVNAGYTRQNQNRSNDWDIGVGFPLPLWDRNQGNIIAAKAQVSEAVSQVRRVENELVNRLATSFGTYAAARTRAERYKSDIRPKAQETYELSLKAYQGGQFEYLRVLQAQRAVAEANLEYLRSLGEMWRYASEVAGLMLEDQWPLAPAPIEKKLP